MLIELSPDFCFILLYLLVAFLLDSQVTKPMNTPIPQNTHYIIINNPFHNLFFIKIYIYSIGLIVDSMKHTSLSER